jgi:hypothetical protein
MTFDSVSGTHDTEIQACQNEMCYHELRVFSKIHSNVCRPTHKFQTSNWPFSKYSSSYSNCSTNNRITKYESGSTLLSQDKNYLTFQSLAVTLRTTRFNIKKFYVVPTLRLCVLYGSQNKQQLMPYKTLRDWFL